MMRCDQPDLRETLESGTFAFFERADSNDRRAADRRCSQTTRSGRPENPGNSLQASSAFRTAKFLLGSSEAGKLRSLSVRCALGRQDGRKLDSVIHAINAQMQLAGELVGSKPDWSMVDAVTHADLELWDSVTVAIGFECGLLAQVEVFPFDESAWIEIKAATDNLCVTLTARSGEVPLTRVNTLDHPDLAMAPVLRRRS